MVDPKRLQLLISTAASMGLQPEQVKDLGLISIIVAGKKHYLFHKVSNPNNQMSSWLAENKSVSRIIFEQNNLPNIPFIYPVTLADAEKFLEKHDKIIVKPVKGKHSEDIHLVSDRKDLSQLDLTGRIAEKFIKGQEVRLLVVDYEVKSVHLKVYDSDINNPALVNRISLEAEQWDKALVEKAVKAASALGLVFTAVDFLVTQDGDAYILEINSAPGLEFFQEPTKGPAFDAMRAYLELVVRSL